MDLFCGRKLINYWLGKTELNMHCADTFLDCFLMCDLTELSISGSFTQLKRATHLRRDVSDRPCARSSRHFNLLIPPHRSCITTSTMSTKPEDKRRNNVGLVLLAAGYGTRLARDIASSSSFKYLINTPKPLLPLGGRVLLSHWLQQFSALPTLTEVVVVTNEAHQHLYKIWASQQTHPIRIISDGSTSNENRVGAVAAMHFGMQSLSAKVDIAIIVAGDTLLPSLDTRALLHEFTTRNATQAVCAYSLRDPADCVRRGMLRIDTNNVATELVEKPTSIATSPSNLASAPVYLLRRAEWGTFAEFLAAHAAAPMKKRDAPGFWVRWAIPRTRTHVLQIDDRIDIGGLAHYREALARFCDTGASISKLQVLRRAAGEPAVGRAYSRAGVLGNPSDGYRGKTIAIALASEGFAEVIATPSERFCVARNSEHELADEFDSIHQLSSAVHSYGVNYGARPLVLAACAFFSRVLSEARGKDENGVTSELTNCTVSYATSIPARLGLSGSSALILATLRALARFHDTSLYALDKHIETWPARLLAVERELLGIEGGLMDRVAQVYQGCMYMDFSGDKPRYTRLDHTRLPQLWIGYRTDRTVGECSGKVHSDLGKRFRLGDEHVLHRMRLLGKVAERGRDALAGGDMTTLPALMRENFKLRVELVGTDVVGASNLHLIHTAEKAGFAAKMCGSGGAVICVADPVRKLSEEEVQAASAVFGEAGLVLRPVEVLPECEWTGSEEV